MLIFPEEDAEASGSKTALCWAVGHFPQEMLVAKGAKPRLQCAGCADPVAEAARWP